MVRLLIASALLLLALRGVDLCAADPLAAGAEDTEAVGVVLRSQELVDGSSVQYSTVEKSETWAVSETAVIVCDMWDLHHCYRAVQRENQMVPRMNKLLSKLRRHGAVIIHAPSSCVDFYADHPARKRVLEIPIAAHPNDINAWCRSIPAEEVVKYPIDQSDGGEDDAPDEHAKWVKQLESQGRNPKAPWVRQHEGLTIDADQDYISDRGDEVWSILADGKIKNIILVGVHVNMCVLGRPFGLRQLAKNNKHVVLMRDLTDSMYNPKMWPHVSHHQGTQLIIRHIERHVCPTISSDQILGGEPFRFQPLP